MTTARLIQSIPITASNNALRITHASIPGTATVTIAAGTTYWPSLDGGATDIYEAIVAAVNAAITGTYTIQAIGVDSALSFAEGRLYHVVTGGSDLTLEFTDPLFTLDSRILGYDGTADVPFQAAVSTWCHRYGWYPETHLYDEHAIDRRYEHIADSAVDGTIDADHIRTYDYHRPLYEAVPEAKMRYAYRTDTNRMGAVVLVVGDESASLESFLTDHITTGSQYREYPDATDTATFNGPFRVPARSDLRALPLALSTRRPNAGAWDAVIEGRS